MTDYRNMDPALLDERDCSADFVDCLADGGSVLWNRSEGPCGKYTGVFFFNNLYVVCRYCSSDNVISFSFESPQEQIDSFVDMIENDLFKESDSQGIAVNVERGGGKVWVSTYFKPEARPRHDCCTMDTYGNEQ